MDSENDRRPALGRRTVLGAGAGAAASTAAGLLGAAPAAVAAQPPDLWREFRADPYRHPQIPYVGRAGFLGGRAVLPRYPVAADVRRYGARPDGSADAAPAINRAIEAVGRRGGGTVVVPPGTYRVDGIIRIGYDNVVLRGAGSGRTRLHATRSLTELIGPYGSRYGGTKSSWSWAGGLIWVCPDARWRSLTAAIRDQAWPFEGWTGDERDAWHTLTAVDRPARRGDWTVPVESTAALRRGDRVLLQLADDATHTLLQHMAGDVEGAAGYAWADKTKLTSYVPYEWPCRITAAG